MPEIPNVVTGETIQSVEWGNPIRDRTVQRYASVTERTALHPSPSDGDLAYLEDSGDVDVFHSGAWRHLGAQTGSVQMFAGTVIPDGWLLCNGQAVSRTTFARLFSALSTAFGAGDGTTTFNVPDLRQRFPLGKADAGTGNALGATGGAIDHRHTGPSHVHAMTPHTHGISNHTHDLGDSATDGGGGATSLAGSHAHSFSDSFTTGTPSQLAGSGTTSAGAAGHAHTHSGTVSGSTDTETSHSHTIPNHKHDLGSTIGTVAGAQTGDGSASLEDTGSAGNGNTGTNNPPFLVLQFIIKS